MSTASREFEDRVVVVTGGTGGLGRAVVAALLEAGARVHVPVFEDQTPAGVEFADHERVTFVHGVALDDEAAAADFYRRTPPPWASIQIAGGFAMSPVVDTSFSAFESMWRMNVASCFLSCREAVRRMREGGGGGGRLVNIAARPALTPSAGMIAYATAKAGVAAMTRTLAEELAPESIWVNAVAPSIIDTPANRAAMPDADHGSWVTPAALAQTIVGLASPANQCVRGAVLEAYGRA
ncbi:SDR family NAD(P)-dependent oxidoreductase [Pseudenhygromyxa sp. WMMC2535]|uniref:SDR family NAD(P)-dependent oxidoreductase n=1 Tax=Pseudenhygromyxa sp. WMMC2535 TaxID=2712867 RepID=UPI001553135E|nr:SDR family NAD(P)-dependent oxidoreductase [Pseudenhygromyxa sp. WMMC2535]NVB37209.1 SDR family NAD(P)-dependent oxidoreductase [Pseudenhygromyxa sp. WMMC2535]